MKRRQRGFTLLEVVIAFALLALALGLLLGALNNSARAMRDAADASAAALHARSLLQDLGVGVPLEPGSRQGVFENGRFRWTLQLRPHAQPLPPPLQAGYRMLHVNLTVQWGDGGAGRELQIRSLRLTMAGTV